MSDEQAPNLIYLVMLLVFVASSLFAMRLPIARTMKMAAAWGGIFALGFAVFAFRGEFQMIGQRLKAEAMGSPVQLAEELRIPIAEDGHFWVKARVNGHEAQFLVDSGASVTTISNETAQKAGISPGMRIAMVQTANGLVSMRKARADRFSVGEIQRDDFSLQVNDRDSANVLGMNFLSSLASWRVEGSYLVLRP